MEGEVTVKDAGKAQVVTASESEQADARGPQRTIALDDSGDALLMLGTSAGTQPVQVSKAVMTLASPVWKAMFKRHWKENEATEIPLPEDDVGTMLIVLRIAHLRFHELLKKKGLTIDALLALAVVCDKYDIVPLVRPFLDLYDWAQCHLPDTISGERCDPAWFFIAWTFGYRESFTELADFVVKRTGLDENGFLVTDDEPGFPSHMPPGLIELMADVRKTTLGYMLEVIYDVLDRILKGPVCVVKESRGPVCGVMTLDSYISFLLAKGLYPVRRPAAETSLSIQELYDASKEVGIAITGAISKHTYIHCGCFKRYEFLPGLKEIYQVKDMVISKSHVRHMAEQAKK
ncbi:nuclear pore [Pyrenophora seminiperda CCB06]|uniref:Nuclear pore n=1 Tax=Pyrenophora seminiperda CCB06 TaxID=1302712 RepID=A0A3M7MIU7_9PLEO|nr:nuclear pore [Pyrenophora seminiperda CCB06]